MADAGAEFNMLEEVDAVRMVWNVWPYSRLEAAKCGIPFGVMYTPAKQTSNLQVRPLFLVFWHPKKQDDDCRQTTASNQPGFFLFISSISNHFLPFFSSTRWLNTILSHVNHVEVSSTPMHL